MYALGHRSFASRERRLTDTVKHRGPSYSNDISFVRARVSDGATDDRDVDTGLARS